jgi:hypothetical protein
MTSPVNPKTLAAKLLVRCLTRPAADGGRYKTSAGKRRREKLSLTLLVLRVGADHAHNAAAMDYFALVTNLFYRCSNFHC